MYGKLSLKNIPTLMFQPFDSCLVGTLKCGTMGWSQPQPNGHGGGMTIDDYLYLIGGPESFGRAYIASFDSG